MTFREILTKSHLSAPYRESWIRPRNLRNPFHAGIDPDFETLEQTPPEVPKQGCQWPHNYFLNKTLRKADV